MTTKPDDLEAVRTIVATLSPFDANEQERILRWSREKLGLSSQAGPIASSTQTPRLSADPSPPPASRSHGSPTDIKSFVAEKAPSSNNEFTATVAYYHRFEAPESARKATITADDLQEACRLAGRTRLQKPAQTLVHAHNVGLLDKAGDRGAYSISTVGENLVAMALPSGGKKVRPAGTSSRRRSSSKKAAKSAPSNTPRKAAKKR
ncbi:MAG TPA: hypothetical protein VI750_09305 [Pyrinomonadaceae bacterium]|nr:hypothetical protein [Pyrinomonadaceae bacterium]